MLFRSRMATARAATLVAASAAECIRTLNSDVPVSTVGRHAVLVEYGTSAKTGVVDAATDIPVLRMGNIKDGKVDRRGLKFLPADHSDFPRLLLRDGDLLFNRTNSAEHVGKSAVFHGDELTSFASYLIRVRFDDSVLPDWANLVINSPQGREYVASVVSQQVGQANVNGTKLKAFPLPVPSSAEQQARVTKHLAVVASRDRLLAELERMTVRSHNLRKALLSAAFSGHLTGANSDAAEALEALSTHIGAVVG